MKLSDSPDPWTDVILTLAMVTLVIAVAAAVFGSFCYLIYTLVHLL